MNKSGVQLDLFHQQSLNTTYETKRAMRMAVARSRKSREEIVDLINKVAVQENMRTTISKATLDNWLKDSDTGRLPMPAWMTIFCYVLHDYSPIAAMLAPLGCGVLTTEKQKLLAWAEAEQMKRTAVKRARIAYESLEV
jgi:hypothetical protein